MPQSTRSALCCAHCPGAVLFFDEITAKIRSLDHVRQQKVGAIDSTPGQTYTLCVLLHNMIACSTQRSWGSLYFGAELPTLDEYVAIAD